MDIENFLRVLKDGGKLTFAVYKCEDGGVLYEIYKHPDFGQLAIRTVPPGKTVGEHFHNMEEWWLVFRGKAVVRLEYPSGTRWLKHFSGRRPKIIDLPPGTGHDIKNVGESEMAFIFWAEKLYDPESHSRVPWQWEE